jgi:sugar/nucleoside kinase (ribokinase family)
LDLNYIAGASVFHTGSIALASEPCRSAAIEAMKVARAAGCLVSLDPNVRLSVWRDLEELREVLQPLFSLADVVKLSEEDLGVLTGDEDAESGSSAIIAAGARLVVVTRGANGSFGRTHSLARDVPGYSVPVVETTGAGDAFLAGLIAALLSVGATPATVGDLSGEDLGAILRLANAVGALTTTGRGAIPSLPTRLAVRAFLDERADAESASLI